jgi:hypothetical protein
MLKLTTCGNCKHQFWSKTKKMYVLWITDLEGNKLTTHGGFFTYPEAENAPLKLKATEQRCIERVDLCLEKHCRSCLNLVKSIQKRAIAEQKKRRIALGIKGNKAIPIDEGDYKNYMKYIVAKQIENDQKAIEEAVKANNATKA